MKEKQFVFKKGKGQRFDQFSAIIHKEFPDVPCHFIELQVVARPAGPELLIKYKEPYVDRDAGYGVPKPYMSMAEVLRTAGRFPNFDPRSLWLGWNNDGLFLTTYKNHWRL